MGEVLALTQGGFCVSVCLSGCLCQMVSALFVLCIKRFVEISVLGFQSLDYCVCVSGYHCVYRHLCACACVPHPFGFCGSVCPRVPVDAGVLCVG